MSLRVSFYGGAGKVTGSNFLVETDKAKVLVDCGIEQGADYAVEEVYGPFPYDVSAIDALVVTHAHLDHVGRIPKLMRDGFRGKIYMTPPTKDLATLILLDSLNILTQEAIRLGRQPLYTDVDVEAAMLATESLDYHVEKEIAPGLSLYLRNTGHILGSASVRLKDSDGTSVAFTGDIGNSPSPLLPNWEAVPDADALIMESTYGNKVHTERATRDLLLKGRLQLAIQRGGTILIPAFSVERTQLMLYELSNFFSARDLPQIPVFLDSPLAINVTKIYEKWGMTYFKPEAEDEMQREGSLFEFPFLQKTAAHQDSEAIAAIPGPKIIIAGAGMSHGGRIGRWETRYLPDPKSTIFMVGYQAPGTPGRRILDGEPRAQINGEEVNVRAKVEKLEGWSAHADRDGLIRFAEAALKEKRPKAIFTAHGEPAAERFLAQRIHDYLGARAIVPDMGSTWEVSKESVVNVA